MKIHTRPHAAKAVSWWRNLSGLDLDGSRKQRPASTGALAELRRVRSPIDALLNAQAIELVRQIGAKHPEHQIRVASLAAVLAHIRTDDQSHYLATRLGGAKEDERLMKTIRFRRLMQSEFGEERIAFFRRSIQMLKGVANVADVADAWLSWDHEVKGEQVRVAWMFRYVGASGKELTQEKPIEKQAQDEQHNLTENKSA